jgi:hypothetical protein
MPIHRRRCRFTYLVINAEGCPQNRFLQRLALILAQEALLFSVLQAASTVFPCGCLSKRSHALTMCMEYSYCKVLEEGAGI